jgi:folate/biopterin transporter
VVRGGTEGEEPEEYALPENPTVTDYLMHPVNSVSNFSTRLQHNFGWRFAVQIGIMYVCVKGLLNSTLGLVKLSYCKKTLKIDGNACQTMSSIAMTPWSIKGVFGVLSDSYPLFGYHKKSYIIVAAFFGTAAFVGLAALPINTANIAALFMFLANVQIAVSDLLCEGKYAELMQAKPKTGSSMVSYVWGCYQLGALIASLFVGPIADNYNPQIIFWFCIPLSASIIVPTALDYLADEKVPAEKAGFKYELWREHGKIIFFACAAAVVALGNAMVDLFFFDAHMLQAGYAAGGSVVLCIMAFYCLPRQLAMCNLYMFISSILYINISGSMDFWFTADESCVPGGPAFDYTYYNTYASLVGSVTGSIGIALFQALMGDWNFRTVFWVTTVIGIVAASFDMVIIARWNLAMGISDKAFYMFGDAVIGNCLGMFGLMPMLVLTSKLVPKGLEATTYALLAGFQNFGGVVSSQLGVFASQWAGIKTTEENGAKCNFDNLNMLVFVCHVALPVIAIPLTFVLIPNKRMTDKIITDDGQEVPDDEEQSLENPTGPGAAQKSA